MESIIRVIKGADQGATATLLQGPTVIGRGAKAGLKLTPASVSWEHAVVNRNADDYYLENLSAHGTWVNDTKVSGRVKLRPRDAIKLSDEAILRFEPAGMPQGLMARRNLLIMIILVLLVVVGGLAIFNPFAAPPTPPPNYTRSYESLSKWLDGKVKDSSEPMPIETKRLFSTAWRLYKAEDYADSRDLWLKLQLLMESQDSKFQFHAFAAENPKALDSLNTAPEGSELLKLNDNNEEVARAAFVQFVQRCLDSSAKKVQASEVGP